MSVEDGAEVDVATDLVELATMSSIQPGDVVIFGIATPLTNAAADELRTRLLDRLAGVADVVLVHGLTTVATYRPEQP